MANGADMMTGKRTTTLLAVWISLAMGALAGCGAGGPEVGTAETALEEGRYEAALSRIERVLEQDSTNTDAYLLRADVLRQMADSTMSPDVYKDHHKRARAAEDRALSFDSDLQEEVQTRRKRVFEREIGLGSLAYNQANKRKEQGRYRHAVAFFGAAGIAQPDSARPVLNEALARLRIGQRNFVIPILEEYVERADTATRKAYKILGKLYVTNDQHEKAADLLDRAIRVYPTDKSLQGLRLTAYNQAGAADRALELYREQIEKKPDNFRYRYNYGTLLLEAKRYERAIAQLRRAIEIQPGHIGSQYNLGAAYMNAALARDDSIAALEKKTQGEIPDTTDRQKRTEALVQRRDSLFKESIPPLERARQMEGISGTIRQDACRALLVVYVQTGQPGRAARVEKCTGFAQADS